MSDSSVLPAHHAPRLGMTDIGPPMLVDAHVHAQACFDLGRFIAAMQQNMDEAISQCGLPDETARCLLLCSTNGNDRFDELAESLDGSTWTQHRTAERCSMLYRDESQHVLLVIAGQQIITREGLEVLGIAAHDPIADGLPVHAVLQRVSQCGGYSIIPWGFGKWRLARGRVVQKLLRSQQPLPFALGDNAGRWANSQRPAKFAQAEASGRIVLPGSDPLPIATEVHRVGSYGFVLNQSLSATTPANSLIHALVQMKQSPRVYGRRVGLLECARLQLAMQWKKNMHRTWPSDSMQQRDRR